MTILNNCPVCGDTRFQPFISCKDFTVSYEQFNIVDCLNCSFKFTNPRPEDSVIGSYYKSENYISHSDTRKGFVSQLYHLIRSYTLGKKEALLRKYVSRGTLLDYGCGTGMFLSHCKNKGWKAFGVEPDAGARTLASKGQVQVWADINTMPESEKDFDAITLWHVLEHVGDLSATIEKLKRRLKTNGVLIVAVPNYKSYDAQYYKEHWAAYDVPRHFYHFEISTVQRLMRSHGFDLLETHPMKFDSFYVSMLSEKYKTGKTNLFKAFWIGLISNVKSKTASDYSSVIYVFKADS